MGSSHVIDLKKGDGGDDGGGGRFLPLVFDIFAEQTSNLVMFSLLYMVIG